MTRVEPVSDGALSAGDSRSVGVAGRILRGVAANTAGVGVTLVIQLVSVPMFLAAWGVPTYGEWLILSAVPTYLALSDLSFSSVGGNSMVMLVAQGDQEAAAALGRRLWSMVTAMTGIAVLGTVVIGLVVGGVLGNHGAIPTSEAQTVLIALFLAVAIANQYGVLDAWYRAGGRYPLGAALRQLGRLIEFVAMMVAVLLGAGPAAAAIAFLIGSTVGFLVAWVVLRRSVPWVSFRPELPRLQTFRELLAPGLAFTAFPIGNALSLQGFTIVIGATMGSAAVVVFSTTRTLTRIPLQAMGIIHGSIWPELSRAVGGGRLEEARSILRRSVQASLVLSISLVIGLIVIGTAVIRWWTGALVDTPAILLSILLLVIVANSMWYTLSAVLVATNKHRRMAAIYLSGSVGALLAAVPLSSMFGLAGAAAALLAIDVVMFAYVLPEALRVVQDSPRAFIRALLDVQGAFRSAVTAARGGI